MLRTLIIGAGAILIATQAGQAATGSERFHWQSGGSLFYDREVSLDLYGSYATRDRRHFDDSQAGLGVGLNYFMTRHFGVSADTYMERVDWPTHLDLSVIGRLPMDRVAPYVFAGVGRQWHDNTQWTAHIGGGAEVRLNRKTGIFLDARHVMAEETRNFGLYRLGVRVVF